MTDPDPLLADLATLDPTATDPPPTPGSIRDRLILERAMSTTTETTPDVDGAPPPVIPVDRRIPRRTRRLLILAGTGVAAALLAVVAVTVGGAPGDRPDPVAALTAAADATGDVDSLRVRGTYTRDGETRTLEAEADGSDSHAVFTAPDGSSEERTVIGDQMWDPAESEGPITVTEDMVNAPYPEASQAVVRAALRGATVDDLGREEVAGVEADHYSIELGPAGIEALGDLSPTLVAQFELEDPSAVTDLEVWVADELIRRIEVETTYDDMVGQPPQVTLIVLEFYDIGADITIEPPE